MAMDRERPRGRKRRKVCTFCVDKVEHIDYKDAVKLRRFLSERSKILPRRTTGTCAMHQRQLTEAIHKGRPSGCAGDVGAGAHTRPSAVLPELAGLPSPCGRGDVGRR